MKRESCGKYTLSQQPVHADLSSPSFAVTRSGEDLVRLQRTRE